MSNDLWIRGTVVRGDGRGRQLGFPTANLKLSGESERPSEGIYACRARILPDSHLYRGALHVGPRPTISGATPTVEVHLLDFPDHDLYDETIEFGDLHFIRSIKKFDSLDDLVAAITHDCQHVREIFK